MLEVELRVEAHSFAGHDDGQSERVGVAAVTPT
jgi:hypothetical protein